MAYAIIRVAKMKSMGSVGGQSSHVERLRETPNADAQRLALNQRLAGTDSPVHDVQERLAAAGIEPRKGAVLAIDVFLSASPEHFKTNHPDDPAWKAFQQRAMAFLATEYGASNVVHAIAHHDETSPHLHAIIVPIKTKTIKVGRKVKTERTENRLCCRDWLGGDRSTLSKLQTRFADQVKDLGLQRGIPGSRATHTQVRQFYTVMQETTAQARVIGAKLAPISPDYYVRSVPKPTVLERLNAYQYAQHQVAQSLTAVASQIEQTNANAEIARRGQLVTLQTPVIKALHTKGQTRQSQAEAALLGLGYRLDEHGQLVNVLDARKAALRATISATVRNCTTMDELRPALAQKGLKLTFSKEQPEQANGKTYNGSVYHDGQGDPIRGQELGPDYTTIGLHQQFAQVRALQAQQNRERQYARAYDELLAELFARHQSEAKRVAQYLQAMTQERQRHFGQEFGQTHGPEGAAYAGLRLQADRQKTPSQLSADRDGLKKQGFDVGVVEAKQPQNKIKGPRMG